MSQILVKKPQQAKHVDTMNPINIELQMEHNGLIPEVLDKEPLTTLTTKFDGNLIRLGHILEPKMVKLKPHLEWKFQPEIFYTLIMIDPDYPSRRDNKFREFLHWLVVNIPANNIKHGGTIVDYIGAIPPKGTGLHRYVILLYRQSKKIKTSEKYISSFSISGRTKFSNKAFARKYNLKVVAATFFLSEWDEFVPKWYKQLQMKVS